MALFITTNKGENAGWMPTHHTNDGVKNTTIFPLLKKLYPDESTAHLPDIDESLVRLIGKEKEIIA